MYSIPVNRIFQILFACCCILACGLAPLGWSQETTGTIIGVIYDPSGLPVAGTTAEVLNTLTGDAKHASTGVDGTFTVPNLGPGVYEVSVRKEGFRLVKQRIELLVDQSARLEFRLQIGAAEQSIEVQAEAPLVNTENATRGSVIQNQEITQLPLDGRDIADLAYLVPGVAPTAQGGASSQFAINGSRADNSNFAVDGSNNRDQRTGQMFISPSVESVQEFKMETGNYSAEFGRAGGGMMNIALRSGGNSVHGALFEFLRNDDLDARNFFAQNNNKLRRNQFGGVVDGPVYLPRVYNGRNKTFFMFSWESDREVDGQPGLTNVPTALQRSGNFSQTLGTNGQVISLRDPVANAPFPQNQIPASRVNPVALAAEAYYPLPNTVGANNFAADPNAISNTDAFIVKIDQNFSSRDQLSGRLLWNNALSVIPTNSQNLTGTFWEVQPIKGWTAGLGYTRAITPTSVLQLRADVNRREQIPETQAYPAGNYYPGKNWAGELGITGLTSNPQYVEFPSFTLNGLASLGPGATTAEWFTTYSHYTGTFTWVKGRHLIKFGGEALLDRENEDAIVATANGTFNFLGQLTNSSFGDFLLGLPQSTTRTVSWDRTHMTPNNLSGFIQDDFKASPRITINLGLRYELEMPLSDNRGQWSNFVPALGQIVIGSAVMVPNLAQELAAVGLTGQVITAQQAGLPEALTYPNYHNFAPRAGIAWRPFGGNRTVIRAGYGIFYDSFQQIALRNLLGRSYPFVNTQTYTRSTANVNLLTLSNPFPSSLAAVSGVTNGYGTDLHHTSPYGQSFNLTIERQLGANQSIEIAYAGSTGTHLPRDYDVNQPYYYETSERSAAGAILKPFPVWGTMQYIGFSATSNYNSGVVTFQRRFVRGFFARASYVLAKSIDENSQLSTSSTGGYPLAQDSRNLGLERGRSDFDQRSGFTGSLIYQVAARNVLLRGWQLASTVRAYSGQPFTPRVGSADNLNLGQANRPDRIAVGTLPNPGPNAWFNLSAFPIVPDGAFRPGTSGRNILSGPGYFGVNASLNRSFRIGPTDHSYLQFRWEVFNVLNRVNFNLPNDLVDVVGGATLTSAQDPRTIQFGMRYVF